MKNEDTLYTIGEVSKICNISKKTLRFYDKIGLLCPDKISDETGYRYYGRETLLFVPVIKYYKQMGFKLDEMKSFLEGKSYTAHEVGFRKRIKDLEILQDEILGAFTSVKDWYDLIIEAENVLLFNATEVSIKFVDELVSCYQEFDFDYSYMESIINIEWTNYLEKIQKSITGAVIIHYKDHRAKYEKKPVKARIIQKVISDCGENKTMTIGGFIAISCYHIGSHETINKTYKKMYDWAASHGYTCAESSTERYVTDYWTTANSDEFVTEVIIEVIKRS